MSKGTSIKEAVAKFEEAEKVKATESKIVKLLGQIPPIEKMDASISTFTACEHLSLSTNTIEKIAYLNGLKMYFDVTKHYAATKFDIDQENLKILSLGRNNIKSLTGLEAVGDTLEELWISYNSIEKLKGINVLKKLKVLFIKNNNIKEQQEFNKIGDLLNLVNLNIIGNPICESWGEPGTDTYVAAVTKVIPKLKTLDGYTVITSQPDEDED